MITKKKIWIPIAIAGILLLLSAMGFAYFASDPCPCVFYVAVSTMKAGA